MRDLGRDVGHLDVAFLGVSLHLARIRLEEGSEEVLEDESIDCREDTMNAFPRNVIASQTLEPVNETFTSSKSVNITSKP